MTRVTSTDYRRPYRPRAVSFANRVLPRIGALTPEALMGAAVRRTGLSDFGPADFREPLAVLVDSIVREARLSPVGWLITRERLVGVLESRLRTAAAPPCTPPGSLGAPLVITGLQRTGTTLLHRLLAADPRHRWLASWEALHPAPGDSARRVRNAEHAERALRYLAPDFFAVHPVEARAPEEEVLLLDQSLRSTVPEATLRVPTYARWVEEHDHRPAYETLRRLLAMLSAQRGGARRWVLKTPHHLEWLDVLWAVFPGAKVVWTHRDPVVTLASFCSMVAHGRGVFSDAVGPEEIGRDWLRKVGRMMDRALAARSAHPGAIVDVQYDELVADPLAAVESIYRALGEELSAMARARMLDVLARQQQHRFGRHRYSLGDFGLTEAKVADRFAEYRRLVAR